MCPPYFEGAIFIKAAFDKSISLPFTNGPLSLTVTITDFLETILVTFTFVPNLSVLCAAVNFLLLKICPLAVLLH